VLVRKVESGRLHHPTSNLPQAIRFD